MFLNRREAGKQLAEALTRYRDGNAVVLALPRGGVVLGYEIARALHIPLDIRVARKIGHPYSSEYAICAVDEKGTLLCNVAEKATIDPSRLQKKIAEEQKEAQRRSSTYRSGANALSIKGKTAIIVDDGIATGLTIRLVVQGVLQEEPEKIIVAVPVAPADVIYELKKEVDTVIVLEEKFFGAVGAHYVSFEQVSDEEVIALMRRASP